MSDIQIKNLEAEVEVLKSIVAVQNQPAPLKPLHRHL